jgi:hypothetical protein
VGCLAIATSAAAQQPLSSSTHKTIVTVTGVGLVSIQPVENGYGGPPYLDQGLGGTAFGGAAGVNIFSPSGFSATVEMSTPASISVRQSGRIVGGVSESRLRETLVGALAGWASKSREVLVQGGVSWVAGTPTLNDVPINDSESSHLAFGVGGDAAARIAPRTELVLDVRYWFVPRSSRAPLLGLGSQIARFGVGLRIRMT